MSAEENRIAASATPAGSRRRRAVGAVVFVFACAVGAYFAWWHLSGQYSESTDDAYVGGNVVQITPQVAGAVLSIAADDTEFVKAGQTLVELDKAESRVALEGAEANLAQTVRKVRNLMAVTATLEAGVTQRQTELARAREDLARRERISANGAVSAEEIQHARDGHAYATASLDAAQQGLAAHRTLIEGTGTASHPDVLAAAARVRDAYLAFARTSLPSPVSGFVAKRNVQVGQRVAPGAPLMTVVALEQVWVDANFKERQLAHLRIGQTATVRADLYGSDIVFKGKVAGFSAGTGGAFALLPPQNASGNWIKIVQRVPVRIALDPEEIAKHPLQLGLSMTVVVDTRSRDGQRLPRGHRDRPAYETAAFNSAEALANQRIAAIIAANGGTAVASPALAAGKARP